MLTISNPLNAGQMARYHEEEFSNSRGQYFTERDTIVGTWHGRLAAEWGLVGGVDQQIFERLSNGQDPASGEQLVRHRNVANAMAHRAGFDATFSAPKSVSLTALVGGDQRVRAAHESSVDVALDALEPYLQARVSKNTSETTGRLIAAKFSHDSARPVNGYAAPQLHVHAVIFNATTTADGRVRPLQPLELYRSQQFATAVYRSELASRLTALGYQIERGQSQAPEIRGYDPDYLEAASPRSRQIKDRLAELGRSGSAAAQIVAHQTREAKRDVTREEILRQHQEMAARFGSQPARVVRAADDPPLTQGPRMPAEGAIAYAKARRFEREAVVDERALLTDALVRSMAERTQKDIREAFEPRVGREFLPVEAKPWVPARQFTTPEMIALERANIDRMRAGQGHAPELAPASVRQDLKTLHDHLSPHQQAAVERVLSNRDRVQMLEGAAGVGKTTALRAILDGATQHGYEVTGYAPTSRAAKLLADSGIPSTTIQRLLATENDPHGKRLTVLDETSLASTVQIHALLERQRPQDRILLVGDRRQHDPVDAGAPHRQLQDHGIAVTRLEEIIRQTDGPLKAVVEQLSRGEIRPAVQALDDHGHVHEVTHRSRRHEAIAAAFLKDPQHTLVVAPSNEDRIALNAAIHRAMQATGVVARQEHQTPVLVARQELTGADRQVAACYEVHDVLRYTRGSPALGIPAGAYGRVVAIDPRANTLRVRLDDRHAVTYDPARVKGIQAYQETTRSLAVGDRIQWTAPDRPRGIANRELGTIEQIGGDLRIRLDSGQRVTLPASERKTLELGYAVTSHSSQGQTTDRVLLDVDTSRLGETLVNRRLAYVAISRARFSAEIFTDDRQRLPAALSRDVSHLTAIPAPHVAQHVHPSYSRMAAR